jgi:hypothetical protein
MMRYWVRLNQGMNCLSWPGGTLRRLIQMDPRPKGRIATRILMLACLCLPETTNATARPATAIQDQAEYDIKAAFLINFARFVEWPTQAFAAPTAPLVLGIYGLDPFDRSAFNEIGSKPVNGRRLEVRRIRTLSGIDGCHFLFINSGGEGDLEAILEAVRNKPVLTVGDSAKFNATGGMIRFLIEDRKVRFEVNLPQVERVGLKVSAKLLSLAKVIR